jgi:hypothetical protein
MTEKIVHEWEVYCITDSVYRKLWDTEEPTTCPDNNGHTISTNPPPRIIQTINSHDVKIIEEDGITQGIYKFKGFSLDVPSGTSGNVTSQTLMFSYPISLINGWFISSKGMAGDIIDLSVADNTVIGAIGAPVYTGNTEMTVTSTVTDNLSIGYFTSLTDGSQFSDLGEVLAIDKINSTITVQTPSTNTFSPLSPTYVIMQVKVVENFSIPVENERYAFAEKKVGGKYLPANTPIYVKYTNNEGNAKVFSYNMEYLY